MYGYRRKVLKHAGKFKVVKLTGQHTKYAIQYVYDMYTPDYFERKHEMEKYFNVKNTIYGDSHYFYFQNRKECLKQFTYTVLRWA